VGTIAGERHGCGKGYEAVSYLTSTGITPERCRKLSRYWLVAEAGGDAVQHAAPTYLDALKERADRNAAEGLATVLVWDSRAKRTVYTGTANAHWEKLAVNAERKARVLQADAARYREYIRTGYTRTPKDGVITTL